MIRKFSALIALIAVASLSTAGAQTSWKSGERLNYSVKFGFLNAGTSVLSVDESTLGGKSIYKIQSTITSAPKFFYKIDDRAISYSLCENMRTLRYDKIQNEGTEKSTNITLFNAATGKAQRTEDGKSHPPMAFNKQAIDVLGAIYHVRNQNLAVGRTLKFPVHDGKRDYGMEIVISKRERVRVPAGEFDCFVIEPKLRQADGTFKKKGNMVLWITDDARHIPVRMKIILPFGNLIASLTTATGTI